MASHHPKDAGQVAGKANAKAGVATTPGAEGELEQKSGSSVFASPEDMDALLQASELTSEKAGYFQSQLSKGGMLVTVRTRGGQESEAERILSHNGADLGRQIPAAASAPAAKETWSGGNTIQLQGELLSIHKERVQRGEVRLRREVVTEQKKFNVPVSHEELVVERGPASGSSPAEPMGSSREVRVPLTDEKVTVQKQPVVNEEVGVSKREVPETQPVEETVQHEELKVEEEGKLSPEELRKLRERQKRAA